jgi:hypothetical protein
MIVSGETDQTLLIDAPVNSSRSELIYLTLDDDDADIRRGQGTALVSDSGAEDFPIALAAPLWIARYAPSSLLPGFAHADPWSRCDI